MPLRIRSETTACRKPRHDNRAEQQANEEARRSRDPQVLVARQVEPVRDVPQRPHQRNEKGRSRERMAALQMRQRKSAPAGLLTESEGGDPEQQREWSTNIAQEIHRSETMQARPGPLDKACQERGSRK